MSHDEIMRCSVLFKGKQIKEYLLLINVHYALTKTWKQALFIMSLCRVSRNRSRFNRYVRKLSELYDLPYQEVEKVYYATSCCVADTKMLLGLLTTKTESDEITG